MASKQDLQNIVSREGPKWGVMGSTGTVPNADPTATGGTGSQHAGTASSTMDQILRKTGA